MVISGLETTGGVRRGGVVLGKASLGFTCVCELLNGEEVAVLKGTASFE